MTHAWCSDPSRDEAVRAAEDGRPGPLPTLGECIDGMFPKSGSATSPVERENKGDGMRTERVTLEITHDGANGDPDDWPFDGVLGGEGWIGDGETVRVVPSGEADAEVERLRAEVACCRGLLESANKDRNAALARVAELEAIAKNYPDDLGVMRTTPELSERCNVLAARLVNLHLASLEIPPAETSATQETGLRTERVTLEVVHGAIASINDQRWWDNRLWIEPQKGESVRVVEETHFDDLAQVAMERDAAIRERDAAVAESERRLRLCETMKRDGDSARFHAAVAQARVAELEAASGGGEQEPVAWAVRYPTGRIGSSFDRKEQAEGLARNQGLYELTVVPLYASPPQPRGWLTDDEREAVQWAADAAYDKQHPAEDTLRNLLARSTPPEVVLESWREAAGEVVSLDDVRAALAAIGVEVKEVGK